MGKKAAGNGGRSGPSKAGKRHGTINYPAAASTERIAAQDQGEQQFYSPKQQTMVKEVTRIEYDKALKAFVERTKQVTITVDCVFDPQRGRMVLSPSFFEKSQKDQKGSGSNNSKKDSKRTNV